MVQINTDVSAPAAPAPINYAKYGQAVGSAIEGGASAIGSILKAYKTVNDDMDKEKMKEGMLAEIKTKAPYVLKYAKPNPTFEELSKSAYQLAVVGDLYDKAQQTIQKDANGRPDVTLANKEAIAQMAFAADDKGFETMVNGLNSIISGADARVRSQGIMSALQAGAANAGTKEENIGVAMQQPEAKNLDPAQGIKLLEQSGVAGKDLLNAAWRKQAELIKAEAAKARAKAKEKSDNLRARGNAIRDRVAAEAVIKDYTKAISEHDGKVTAAIKGLTTLQKQIKDVQDKANKVYKFSQDPSLSEESRANYRNQYDIAVRQVEQATSDLANSKEAIQQMEDDRAQITDAMTIFKNEMGSKYGWKLAGPEDVAANPSMESHMPDLEFGRTDSTEAAPAPVEVPKKQPGEDIVSKARRLYDAEYGAGSYDSQPTQKKLLIQTAVKNVK